MRRLAIAVGIAATAFALSAQDRLIESVEVRVVNVDVVVTDRAGKPVQGLTKDDFEVLEDRTPQTITNFTEYSLAPATAGGAAPQQEAQPRHFLLLVDSDSLPPVLRKHVLAALERFVERNMRGEDRASVVNWSRGLRFVAPFTTDKAAIKSALASLEKEGSPAPTKDDMARVRQICQQSVQLARSGRTSMKGAYQECINFARAETSEAFVKSRQLMKAIDISLASMSGGEGKKVLLFAGARLPARPGIALFTFANQLFAPYLTGFDAPHEMPSPEEEASQQNLIEEIGRSANARGVTFYLFSANTPTNLTSAVNATEELDYGSDFLHRANTETALGTLAAMTGGLAVTRESQFDSAIAAMSRDLGSYYSIGYKPTTEVLSHRNVRVRAKNKSYVVRARTTYATQTLDQRMSDRVIANVFSAPTATEWPIKLLAGKPQRDANGNFTVPVEVIFPSTLTLLRQGDELAGGFTVYVAVGNTQGALSTISRHPNPVVFPPNEEAGFRAQPIAFTATLTVRPGENLLSIGVLDQVGNTTGFARTAIVAK